MRALVLAAGTGGGLGGILAEPLVGEQDWIHCTRGGSYQQCIQQQHPQCILQVWARVFGQLANLFFALLMLPVSRGSVLWQLFGVSWEAGIAVQGCHTRIHTRIFTLAFSYSDSHTRTRTRT